MAVILSNQAKSMAIISALRDEQEKIRPLTEMALSDGYAVLEEKLIQLIGHERAKFEALDPDRQRDMFFENFRTYKSNIWAMKSLINEVVGSFVKDYDIERRIQEEHEKLAQGVRTRENENQRLTLAGVTPTRGGNGDADDEYPDRSDAQRN